MFGSNVKDYHLLSEVSTSFGGMATVYLSTHTPSGKIVSVKLFRLGKKSYEEEELLQREILNARQFQHPNILKYLTSFVNGPNVYVISPLMAYGSCKDVIDNFYPAGLPEGAIFSILRDVIHALIYIHDQDFIHRGIRASHILLDANGNAVLGGLRSAGRLISGGSKRRAMYSLPPQHDKALNWLSPEVLEQNIEGHTKKSDVYSLAICACELANGVEPWAEVPITVMYSAKLRGISPLLWDRSTFITSSGIMFQKNPICSEYSRRKFSKSFHKIVQLCLQKMPDSRPSLKCILNHELFTKYSKNDSLLRCLSFVPQLNDIVEDRITTLKEDIEDLHTMSEEWDFT